jgi:hypothetical protein
MTLLLPLRNITNENEETVSPTKKRSRQSLCHVPSHASKENEDRVAIHGGPEGNDESWNDTLESKEKNKSDTFSVGKVFYLDGHDLQYQHVHVAEASKRQKRPKEEASANDGTGWIQHAEPQAEQLSQGYDHNHHSLISTRKWAASKRQSMLLPSDIVSFQKEVAT